MAEYKMTLVQRKNLKENDEKLSENLQIIKDATGNNEWTMEINWGHCAEVYSFGDRPGDTVYDWCMSGIAENIKRLCQNEAAREAFNTSVNQNKIIWTVDKKASSYWSEKIVNGCIEIGFRTSPCNTSEIGSKLESALTTTYEDVEMPIKLRKNIESESVQEKKESHLEKIKEATGRDFEVVVEWAQMMKDHMDPNQVEYFGGLIFDSILEGLSDNIKRICSTEYGKDAFNEFASTGKIIINSNKNDKKAPSYYAEQFINGDVVISFKYICNCYEIGSKLKNLLTCTFEDVVIPLQMRLDLAEHEEKREEHLDKLNQATGRNFTLTVQWAELLKDHCSSDSDKDRFGGLIWDSVLEGLVGNIVRQINNDVFSSKDAFNEAATTGNIIINSNKNDKKAPSYFAVKFENGDLVVSFKSICNCYDIGSTIPELLTATFEDYTMPFLARKSLAEYEEKREDYMGVINTATGRTLELSVDWAKMVPFIIKDNRADYVGSMIYSSILEGLSSNIKTLCSDELGLEGFNEAATTGKIVLTMEEDKNELKKSTYSYYKESFVNGDLVITFKSICNCYEIGRGIEKLL